MELYTQLQCRALVAQLARPCDWNSQGQGLNPGCSSVSNKTLHLTVSNYITSYSTCTHCSLYDGSCTSSDVVRYYWWCNRPSSFDGEAHLMVRSLITGSTHHCSSSDWMTDWPGATLSTAIGHRSGQGGKESESAERSIPSDLKQQHVYHDQKNLPGFLPDVVWMGSVWLHNGF